MRVAQIIVWGCSAGPTGGGDIFHMPGTGCDVPPDKIMCLSRVCSFKLRELVGSSLMRWGT